MKIDYRFFHLTSICAFLSALAIVAAQFFFTNYATPSSIEEVMQTYTNPIFLGRSWTILLQVFFMFIALWGITAKLYKTRPALIVTGFIFFIFWQVFELIPRSIDLFSISYDLAPRFLESESSDKELILSQTRSLNSINGSISEIRRVMWGFGHLFFGLAFWRSSNFEKVISIIFIGNFIRLTLQTIGRTVGPEFLSYGGIYPFVIFMIPLFILIGIWLWKNAKTQFKTA